MDNMAKNRPEISMTWDMTRIKVMEASKTMIRKINIIKVMIRIMTGVIMALKEEEEDINSMIVIILRKIMRIQPSKADRLGDNLQIMTMDMKTFHREKMNKDVQRNSAVKRIRIRIKTLLLLIKAKDRGKTISMKMTRVNQWLRELLESRIHQQRTINHAISPKARVVDQPSNGPTSQRARNRLSNSNHKCNISQRMTEEELLIKPIATKKVVVAAEEVDVEQTGPRERHMMVVAKVNAIMRRRVSTMRKRRDIPRTKGEANEIGMWSRLVTKEDVITKEMIKERTEERLPERAMIAIDMIIGMTMDTRMELALLTGMTTTLMFMTMVERTARKMAMQGQVIRNTINLMIIAS